MTALAASADLFTELGVAFRGTWDSRLRWEPHRAILLFCMATIRAAVAADAEGIARIFLQSAAHHETLDSMRYFVPANESITARYRDGRQHPPEAAGTSVTLVAEMNGEVMGFVDARLEQSTDAMHRELVYCHVIEIAVEQEHQREGIGTQLLQAAEDWGRGRGAHLASLEYLASNTRAAEFYKQRMGYQVAAITSIKRL